MITLQNYATRNPSNLEFESIDSILKNANITEVL